MSIAQELKDFNATFETVNKAVRDRRDAKEKKLNDAVDRDYKRSITEGNTLRNKWYDEVTETSLQSQRSENAWRDKRLSTYDEDRERDFFYKDVDTLYKLMGGPRGGSRKDYEDFQGEGPEGRPQPDDSALPLGPERTSMRDNGSDGQARVMNASYTPEAVPTQRRGGGGDYDTAAALYETSRQLGIDPYDLASIIDYETGGKWDPDIVGGKGGNYQGLIQFGPEERRVYGFRPGMSKAEQIRGPVAAYLKDRGARPGHGIDELYSIINAGSLKNGRPRYEASDGNGNVRSHAENIRRRNKPRALQLFGDYIVPVEQSIASGGRVQALATGGIVDDDEEMEAQSGMQDNEPAEAAPAAALPEQGPIPPERPQYSSEEAIPVDTSEGNTAPAKKSEPSSGKEAGFRVAHTAVRDALEYGMQQFGMTSGRAIQDPEAAKKMYDYMKGAGAAPKSVIDQAYDKVDPDKELPESERTMAALATVYDHYTKIGEPEKARAAALSIIQYQRKMFQTYSSLAKAAISEGDIDGGVQAAIRAYAQVPDGQDFKVSKRDDGRYQIEITDEATGKAIAKPVLTPQEIGGWAMKVEPGAFDQFIVQAASNREAAAALSPLFQEYAARVDAGEKISAAELSKLPADELAKMRALIDDASGAGEFGDASKKFQDLVGEMNRGVNVSAEAIAELSPKEQNAFYKLMEYKEKQGASDVERASMSQINEARGTIRGVVEEMAAETDPDTGDLVNGKLAELKGKERIDIADAATDIFVNPRNRGDDTLSEQDALEFAGAIGLTGEFSASKKDSGYVVILPDRRSAFVPRERFKRLENMRKARDSKTAASQAEAEAQSKAEAEQTKRDIRGRQVTTSGGAAQEQRLRTEERRNSPAVSGGAAIPGVAPPSNGWDDPVGVPSGVTRNRGMDSDPQSALEGLQNLLGW